MTEPTKEPTLEDEIEASGQTFEQAVGAALEKDAAPLEPEPEKVAGEVYDEETQRMGQIGQTIQVRSPQVPSLPMELTVDDLVARLTKLREAAAKALSEGVDYGKIPGVDKPSLWKPGAEKLCVLFMLDPQTEVEERYTAGGHLNVIAKTTMFHSPTGARLGSGIGICTTKETRYAYRQADRVCPKCGEAAIIKGKAEYGGGWLCFKKKNGCGEKWADGDAVIESQTTGRIDNPDLPDLYNTVVKMARKRSLVDAVLVTTGASEIYTQDVEDIAPPAEESGTTKPTAK